MLFPLAWRAVGSVLLVAAAMADVRGRRIPNALTGALAAAGLAAQEIARGPGALAGGALAGLIVLLVLWRPWRARRLGGGDVKAAAAAAIWIGPAPLIEYALLTALAGGVLALPCYWLSSRETRALVRANLAAAATRGELPPAPARGGRGRVSVPYAAAAALAALIVLWTGTWGIW